MTHDTQARIEALEMCRAAILSHADGWRDRPAVLARILAEATRLARRAAKLRGVVVADGKGTVA